MGEAPEELEPLSAEELFEQHKAEIDAAFEEKGFIRRMCDMFFGFLNPRSSVEYRIAVSERQRLVAPLAAILLPVLGIFVLVVATSITLQTDRTLQVDIARVQENEMELEAESEPEEPEERTPSEEIVNVTVDLPDILIADTAIPNAPALQNLTALAKPATRDSIALIKSPVTMRAMTGSRTSTSIGALTRGGGMYGDAQTEAAVLKALRWLKRRQYPSGAFDQLVLKRTNGRSYSNPCSISNTGLAVLAYLAHGETPSSAEFGPTVRRALEFLFDSFRMKKNRSGQEFVTFRHTDEKEYATLIATYALCEAYGMTRNPNVKHVAQRTLQRIVDSQSPTGGWDYGLNSDSTRDDVSYAGWALQALKAGKMAGLHPEGLDTCIKKAIMCLKTRNFKNGGFNYTADGASPTGLTATGCLAMQLLGCMNEPEVRASLNTMRAWKPSFTGNPDKRLDEALPDKNPQYYCYYASQCKYQAGMCQDATPANVKTWQDWNLEMKALYPARIRTLPETIEGPDGKPCAIGYWEMDKCEKTCQSGGDVMATCLCALQLMVYYRYLPTTQTYAANASTSGANGTGKGVSPHEIEVEVDI